MQWKDLWFFIIILCYIQVDLLSQSESGDEFPRLKDCQRLCELLIYKFLNAIFCNLYQVFEQF